MSSCLKPLAERRQRSVRGINRRGEEKEERKARCKIKRRKRVLYSCGTQEGGHKIVK